MKRSALLLPAVLLSAPIAAVAAGSQSAPNLATSSAHAKASPGSHKTVLPAFHKADKNGDGVIEWSEAKAAGMPKSVFKHEDVHHDGKLTLTEWREAKIGMLHVGALPDATSKSLPKVPKKIAKAMSAATAPVKASAPSPMTMNKGSKSHGG